MAGPLPLQIRIQADATYIIHHHLAPKMRRNIVLFWMTPRPKLSGIEYSWRMELMPESRNEFRNPGTLIPAIYPILPNIRYPLTGMQFSPHLQ